MQYVGVAAGLDLSDDDDSDSDVDGVSTSETLGMYTDRPIAYFNRARIVTL